MSGYVQNYDAQVYVKQSGSLFEARCAFSLFSVNGDDDPYNENYKGSWCVGLGKTEEEATNNLKDIMRHTASSIEGFL